MRLTMIEESESASCGEGDEAFSNGHCVFNWFTEERHEQSILKIPVDTSVARIISPREDERICLLMQLIS